MCWGREALPNQHAVLTQGTWCCKLLLPCLADISCISLLGKLIVDEEEDSAVLPLDCY